MFSGKKSLTTFAGAADQGGKHARWFLILFTLAFVFALSLLKVYDYDVWTHIKSGEYMLRNMTVLDSDVFSYTASGHPLISHEWGGEVALYLIHAAGGATLLSLFKATMITATFAVFLVRLTGRGINAGVAAIVVAIAALLAKERFLERPELFSFLLVAVFLVMLESFRTNENEDALSYRRLWAMPALMLVWANIHAGAVYGIMIIGAYLFGAALTALVKTLKGKARWQEILRGKSGRLAIVFVAAILAGLVNPSTYHLYTLPLFALKISRATGLGVAEFLPPTWATDYLFFIFLALSALLLAVNFKRVAPAHVVLFVLFGLSAIKINRSISLWAIVMVPVMSVYADTTAARAARAIRSKTIKTAVAAVLVALIIVPSIVQAHRAGVWGTGVMEDWFPENAVQFIEKNEITGNMFNSYEFGGYLIWRTYPERLVYVDGRNDVYLEHLVEQRMLAKLGFDKIVERHGIDYAIISYNPSNIDYIAPDPYFGGPRGLALVYWDDVAMVYVKRTPANRRVIERFEYKYAKPTDTTFRFTNKNNPAALAAELKRNIREHPKAKKNHLMLNPLYSTKR